MRHSRPWKSFEARRTPARSLFPLLFDLLEILAIRLGGEFPNEPDGAATHEVIVELDPARGDAYFYLGATYFKQRNLDEAVRVWKRAVEVDRQSFDSAFALGALLAELQQYADARPHLESAAKLRPKDPAAQFELGRLHFQLGQFPQALALLKTAIASNPASKQASFFLARTYRRLGRTLEAEAEFERGKKLADDETTGLANTTAARGLSADAR